MSGSGGGHRTVSFPLHHVRSCLSMIYRTIFFFFLTSTEKSRIIFNISTERADVSKGTTTKKKWKTKITEHKIKEKDDIKVTEAYFLFLLMGPERYSYSVSRWDALLWPNRDIVLKRPHTEWPHGTLLHCLLFYFDPPKSSLELSLVNTTSQIYFIIDDTKYLPFFFSWLIQHKDGHKNFIDLLVR